MERLSELHTECMNQKAFMATQITEWQDRIDIRKQKIKLDFKNLHTFLHEEEWLYLWRLEKEEEQMMSRLKESEANLQQKIDELKSHILELEAKCQSSPQKLLQGVKSTLSRICAVKLEALEVFPLKIQTACDVAELYLDVKAMLRHCRGMRAQDSLSAVIREIFSTHHCPHHPGQPGAQVVWAFAAELAYSPCPVCSEAEYILYPVLLYELPVPAVCFGDPVTRQLLSLRFHI
ncbi:E3 ubiquitin-protein ligase TRIM38-like [Heterocephalus glaber]|uniref:E3 ubiquitin-protein ligase TRIM38-like n=1 Tax=Heterocephalus glaber TaxID=10181 RepID=A0AAX6T3S7_HETGA|nr:E3 ubiquitin-protein ligase TRIM38-like [Heterocephalus glaber]